MSGYRPPSREYGYTRPPEPYSRPGSTQQHQPIAEGNSYDQPATGAPPQWHAPHNQQRSYQYTHLQGPLPPPPPGPPPAFTHGFYAPQHHESTRPAGQGMTQNFSLPYKQHPAISGSSWQQEPQYSTQPSTHRYEPPLPPRPGSQVQQGTGPVYHTSFNDSPVPSYSQPPPQYQHVHQPSPSSASVYSPDDPASASHIASQYNPYPPPPPPKPQHYEQTPNPQHRRYPEQEPSQHAQYPTGVGEQPQQSHQDQAQWARPSRLTQTPIQQSSPQVPPRPYSTPQGTPGHHRASTSDGPVSPLNGRDSVVSSNRPASATTGAPAPPPTAPPVPVEERPKTNPSAFAFSSDWQHFGSGADEIDDTAMYGVRTDENDANKLASVELPGSEVHSLKITEVSQSPSVNSVVKQDESTCSHPNTDPHRQERPTTPEAHGQPYKQYQQSQQDPHDQQATRTGKSDHIPPIPGTASTHAQSNRTPITVGGTTVSHADVASNLVEDAYKALSRPGSASQHASNASGQTSRPASTVGIVQSQHKPNMEASSRHPNDERDKAAIPAAFAPRPHSQDVQLLRQAQQELEKARVELAQTEEARGRASREAADLRANVEQKDDLLAAKDAEIKQRNAHLAELQKSLDDINETFATFKASNADLEIQFKQINEDKIATASQLQQSEVKRAEMKQKLDQTETANNVAREAHERLAAELENKVKDAVDSIVKLEEELRVARGGKESAEQQVKAIQSAKDTLHQELNSIQTAVDGVETQLQSMRSEKGALEKQLVGAHQENEELSKKLENVQNESATALISVGKLKQQLEQERRKAEEKTLEPVDIAPDLDPWFKGSLERYKDMLSTESKPIPMQDKLQLFLDFVNTEARLRGINMPLGPQDDGKEFAPAQQQASGYGSRYSDSPPSSEWPLLAKAKEPDEFVMVSPNADMLYSPGGRPKLHTVKEESGAGGRPNLRSGRGRAGVEFHSDSPTNMPEVARPASSSSGGSGSVRKPSLMNKFAKTFIQQPYRDNKATTSSAPPSYLPFTSSSNKAATSGASSNQAYKPLNQYKPVRTPSQSSSQASSIRANTSIDVTYEYLPGNNPSSKKDAIRSPQDKAMIPPALRTFNSMPSFNQTSAVELPGMSSPREAPAELAAVRTPRPSEELSVRSSREHQPEAVSAKQHLQRYSPEDLRADSAQQAEPLPHSGEEPMQQLDRLLPSQPESSSTPRRVQELNQALDNIDQTYDLRGLTKVFEDEAGAIRSILEKEREKRQTDLERRNNELYEDGEIGYGDLDELESKGKQEELRLREKEEAQEYTRYSDQVFDVVFRRCSDDVETLTKLQRDIEGVMGESHAGLSATEGHSSLSATMELLLRCSQALEAAKGEITNAVRERDRRYKLTRTKPLYAKGDIAGMKRVEHGFEDAEQKADLKTRVERTERCKRVWKTLGAALQRGLSGSDGYLADILTAAEDASDTASEGAKPELRTLLNRAETVITSVFADAESMVKTFASIDSTLNDCEYEVSIASAKLKGQGKEYFDGLEKEKKKEDGKLAAESKDRLQALKEHRAQIEEQLADVVKEVDQSTEEKEATLRRKTALEEARRRNGGI